MQILEKLPQISGSLSLVKFYSDFQKRTQVGRLNRRFLYKLLHWCGNGSDVNEKWLTGK